MRTGPEAVDPRVGSNKRPHGGSRARFAGTFHHANKAAASLRADNPALAEGRSIFRNIVDPADSPRVLVSGANNAKLGRTVEKGAWAGMPIFQLTLEERATCPRTCELWAQCMGNTMHLARRHKHGPSLIAALDREVRQHARDFPTGFAVRLHVLGDFYSVEYVHAWLRWMQQIPQLHVWGYTARLPGTEIGALLHAMHRAWPHRWMMRTSVAPDAPNIGMQVTTIWRQPDGPMQPEGRMCPQSMEKTATCGTCGLCWADATTSDRIVFTGHGRNARGAAQ